jgi:hypothetical protein
MNRLAFYCFVLFLLSCTKETITNRAFPRVTTMGVTDISSAGAVFHGDIFFTSVGVTDYGFVWSNSSFPNINTSQRRSLGSTTTAGPFDATIQGGLIKGKEYAVQAYAISTGFVVYGRSVKFISQ